MSMIEDSPRYRRTQILLPGVLTSIMVGLAAKFISEHYGAPVMLMALLLGMSLAFLSEAGAATAPGIEFASKSLLRIGVALLGLGITVQQIAATGWVVLVITLAGVALTIALGVGLAKLLGTRPLFGLLAGGAVAICGASAALAIASVMPKDERDLERNTAFTVISVTALSTLAMILYPMITAALNLPDHLAGVFFGATIHDVAQVVGAGYSISDEAGATATLIKLIRVSLLVPIVITLSLIFAKKNASAGEKALPLPFFVLAFAAFVLIGSLNLLPPVVTASLLDLSRWCLVTAIAALGMKTSLRKLSDVGGKAIFLICALTTLLAIYALVMILAFVN
ncbi:putative sulfate exporter family transporter [Paracoccus pantotrophus]|uniref:Putative membrane protein n=1 Tax=Paracoccus pantotrophus TaxID=82367 RepID=Q3S8D3_PARPN|nr:putative sulfate exporter family transporter [Paracoccus pantotrophus]AAZ93612.1 putative membrane protein [Paracoccus pantotrophus]RDD96945.1 putative sulfate exporter family transporter [Paracoccus pantotrophus]WGR66581.1 putative sulfate exporter family transporter [Paracoccus pantotrophus]